MAVPNFNVKCERRWRKFLLILVPVLAGVMGIANMLVGAWGITRLGTELSDLVLLDVPSRSICGEGLIIPSYCEAFAQIVLGAGLVLILAVHHQNARRVIGNCWLFLACIGLVLSTANYFFAYFLDCTTIKPYFHAVWIIVHIFEMILVGYFTNQKEMPGPEVITDAQLTDLTKTYEEVLKRKSLPPEDLV